MEIFRKKRGAVSVFLVIILVPIITLSSIFVDVSRVKLAQSVVDSAGDLTLNTILSQYDGDLNEFYGLMASSQSIDEFLETAEDYFVVSMTAQGVETSDAQKYASQIKNILSENTDTTDFLDISLVDENGFTASKVDNGSLANPALVKTQIVEFMKYRSPINGAVELINKFKNSSKQIENAKDDMDLVDKKQKFFEAEGALVEKAYYIYDSLVRYEELKLTQEYVDKMKENLSSYKDDYYRFHRTMIFDLFNTYGHGVFQKKDIEVEPVITKYNETREASATKIKSYLRNAHESMKKYLQAERAFANRAISDYNEKTMYDIQYWIHFEEIVNKGDVYNNYYKAAKELCSNYAKLINATDNAKEGALEDTLNLPAYEGVATTGEKTVAEHVATMSSQMDGIKSSQLNNQEYAYNKISTTLYNISSTVGDRTNSDGIDKEISEIYTEINGYYTTIEKANQFLTKAINLANELPELVEKYNKAKNAWIDKANNTDTDLGNQDKKEIQEIEDKIAGFVTQEKVNAFVQRLGNTQSLFGQIIGGIENIKYNGKPIKEIADYFNFKEASGVSADKISYIKNELEQYSIDSFNFEPKKASDNTATKVGVTKKNHPDIYNTKPLNEMYRWVRDDLNFEQVDEDTIKKAKKAKDDEKKAGEEATKEAKDENEKAVSKNDNEILEDGKEVPLPSALYNAAKTDDGENSFSSKLSKIAKILNSFVIDPSGSLEETGTNLRDDIYVIDYINSMFSYDTYEYEGKYALLSDNEKEGKTPEEILSKYKSSALESKWTSEALTDTYNKSLTNKLINEDNNWSYGNELEYILYGGTNKTNKANAYGRIFALRCGLNAPAMFSRNWKINKNYEESVAIDAIAQAIYVATQGIVPVQLTKLVIIIGLILAESAMDIKYLRAGIPVLIVKGVDDVFVKYNNTEKDAKNMKTGSQGKTGNKNKSSGLLTASYSDYLNLFLFLFLQKNENANGIYTRIADVIQVNMKNNILEDSFEMSKSQVYFKIKAKTEVSALMLELPINSDIENNITDVLEWRTYEYSAIRGY